jgi:hypothetical protein
MTRREGRTGGPSRGMQRATRDGTEGLGTASPEVWVQLATRIPRTLHRQLKVYCVKAEQPLMRFVVEALAEKLRQDSGRQPR